MKIILVGAKLFHAGGGGGADRRTDMTKLTNTFCNFANAHKNEQYAYTFTGANDSSPSPQELKRTEAFTYCHKVPIQLHATVI